MQYTLRLRQKPDLLLLALLLTALFSGMVSAANAPTRASHGMVISASDLASKVGAQILQEGGSAIDAAVATAFALAVTYPSAGNIGGGGFLVYRPDEGQAMTYDFREVAPAAATPEMWLVMVSTVFRNTITVMRR